MDLNRGSLEWEATALPTEPQPQPSIASLFTFAKPRSHYSDSAAASN